MIIELSFDEFRGLPDRLYVESAMKSDVISGVFEDYEVVYTVVILISVNVVNNMSIFQFKELTDDRACNHAAITALTIRKPVSCLEKSCVAFIVAKMIRLLSDFALRALYLLATSGAGNKHRAFCGIGTGLFEDFIDGLPADSVPLGKGNHGYKLIIVSVNDVNLLFDSQSEVICHDVLLGKS